MALTTTDCFFDGNNIASVIGGSLIDHNFNDLPNREIRTYKLARANKSITTSAEYSSKGVTVSFHLRGCNRGETEDVMSALKALLRGVSKDLIISQGGDDITYQGATLSQIDYRWFSNKIILTLLFELGNPIGFEDTEVTLLTTNITTTTNSSAVTVGGSFDAQPVISLTYNSVTDGTGQSVTVRNEETSQGITVEDDFSTNDTLEIDSLEKTVVLNGGEVNYSGTFPTFPPGVGAFGYVDTFSDRDVDVVITYKKRYI